MADILLVVDDDASLTTGDTVVLDILTGEGHTVTERSFTLSELTTGYDACVISPSFSFGSSDTKYCGDNFPTLSLTRGRWPVCAGMAPSGAPSQSTDGTTSHYETDSVFSWTGETVGTNVSVTSDSSDKVLWYSRAGSEVEDQVAVLINVAFGASRGHCYAVASGDTKEDTTAADHNLVWVGWGLRINGDSLTTEAEQFIVDALNWVLGDVAVLGAATISTSMSVSATGIRDIEGAANISVDLTVSSGGIRYLEGDSSLGMIFSVAGTGDRVVLGETSIPLDISLEVEGVRETLGDGSVPVSFTLSADGDAFTVGEATVPITFATTVTGQRTLEGVVDIDVLLSVSASAENEVEGVGSVPITISVSGEGTREVEGAAAGSLSISITPTGVREVLGEFVHEGIAISPEGSAEIDRISAGSVSLALGTLATGLVEREGASTASITFTLAAAGQVNDEPADNLILVFGKETRFEKKAIMDDEASISRLTGT